MVFLLVQYLKVFAVLTRSRFMHACSLGMSLDDHKQLLGGHFSELLPLCHLSSAFWFPGLLFSVFQSESWGFGYPILLHFCNCAWVQPKDREGEKATRLALSSQDDNPTNQRGRFSPLRILASASYCHHHGCSEPGIQRNEEKQKQVFTFYHT